MYSSDPRSALAILELISLSGLNIRSTMRDTMNSAISRNSRNSEMIVSECITASSSKSKVSSLYGEQRMARSWPFASNSGAYML